MYDFSPLIKVGIAAGKYVPVSTTAGVPIGMVRSAETGRFVAHAVGMGANSLNPLTAAPQLIMSAGQLYQGHQAIQGITALQASVSALQSTTALIGVGTVATGALAAVNLWQTLKLRKDVKQMRVEMQDGFIDLKQAFAIQGNELVERIQQVSNDVEFKHHKTILIRAYGLFEKSLDRLRSATKIQDPVRRSDEITACRDMMMRALADYDRSELMSGVGSAAYLRRRECVWAIEQAIAMTYQMQGEWQAVGDRLTNLNAAINRNAIRTLDKAEIDDNELDFLFPELSRIRDHDLVAIEAWQHHAEWYDTLSSSEIKQLNEAISNEQTPETQTTVEAEIVEEKPAEYVFYEDVKEKFVNRALYDSLVYSFDVEERRATESYIRERASFESLTSFSKETLQQASPLTVANLALYFEIRDESLEDSEEESANAVA